MPLDPESLDDQSRIVHKSARDFGRGLITSVAWRLDSTTSRGSKPSQRHEPGLRQGSCQT